MSDCTIEAGRGLPMSPGKATRTRSPRVTRSNPRCFEARRRASSCRSRDRGNGRRRDWTAPTTARTRPCRDGDGVWQLVDDSCSDSCAVVTGWPFREGAVRPDRIPTGADGRKLRLTFDERTPICPGRRGWGSPKPPATADDSCRVRPCERESLSAARREAGFSCLLSRLLRGKARAVWRLALGGRCWANRGGQGR